MRDSLDCLPDSLLNFVLVGSAFVSVPCANSAEIDDNKAAMVWVIFPGFMKQWQHNALLMVGWTRRQAVKVVPDRASGLILNQRSEGHTFDANPT